MRRPRNTWRFGSRLAIWGQLERDLRDPMSKVPVGETRPEPRRLEEAGWWPVPPEGTTGRDEMRFRIHMYENTHLPLKIHIFRSGNTHFQVWEYTFSGLGMHISRSGNTHFQAWKSTFPFVGISRPNLSPFVVMLVNH
ncbi:origin recognition complex subunit 1 [Biomphalaria glabrata]|nr:origin recognition complex subunit 1 [Biomphalaria glabrata]